MRRRMNYRKIQAHTNDLNSNTYHVYLYTSLTCVVLAHCTCDMPTFPYWWATMGNGGTTILSSPCCPLYLDGFNVSLYLIQTYLIQVLVYGIFPIFNMNMENILHIIVSPTKHCYEFEQCNVVRSCISTNGHHEDKIVFQIDWTAWSKLLTILGSIVNIAWGVELGGSYMTLYSNPTKVDLEKLI